MPIGASPAFSETVSESGVVASNGEGFLFTVEVPQYTFDKDEHRLVIFNETSI